MSEVDTSAEAHDWTALRRLAQAATPGPWRVQDSNSWRRIGTDQGDGDVLRPATPVTGQWPDLVATRSTLAYIAAANPVAVLALLDRAERVEAERDAARAVVARLREALSVYASVSNWSVDGTFLAPSPKSDFRPACSEIARAALDAKEPEPVLLLTPAEVAAREACERHAAVRVMHMELTGRAVSWVACQRVRMT